MDDGASALTFQVYEPDALPGPRPAAQRRASVAAIETTKPSVAVRACLFLLGLCVVVGTASAVVAVTSDDAPRPAAARANPVLLTTASVPVAAPETDPASPVAPPSSPIDVTGALPTSAMLAPFAAPNAAPPATTASTPATSPTTKPKKLAPPAAVRQAAPPPNPYGGAAAAAPRPKKPLPAGNPF